MPRFLSTDAATVGARPPRPRSLVALLISGMLVGSTPVSAGNFRWHPQEIVAGTTDNEATGRMTRDKMWDGGTGWAIATDGDEVVVVYARQNEARFDGKDTDIYFTRRATSGSSWTTPVLVANHDFTDESIQSTASVAIAPNGTIHVVYQSAHLPCDQCEGPWYGTRMSEVFHKYSTDDGATWLPAAGEAVSSTTDLMDPVPGEPAPCGFAFEVRTRQPSVTVLPDGKVVVMWVNITDRPRWPGPGTLPESLSVCDP